MEFQFVFKPSVQLWTKELYLVGLGSRRCGEIKDSRRTRWDPCELLPQTAAKQHSWVASHNRISLKRSSIWVQAGQLSSNSFYKRDVSEWKGRRNPSPPYSCHHLFFFTLFSPSCRLIILAHLWSLLLSFSCSWKMSRLSASVNLLILYRTEPTRGKGLPPQCRALRNLLKPTFFCLGSL